MSFIQFPSEGKRELPKKIQKEFRISSDISLINQNTMQ